MKCAFCDLGAVCWASHDSGDVGIPVCYKAAVRIRARGYILTGLKVGQEHAEEMTKEATSKTAMAAVGWE